MSVTYSQMLLGCSAKFDRVIKEPSDIEAEHVQLGAYSGALWNSMLGAAHATANLSPHDMEYSW